VGHLIYEQVPPLQSNLGGDFGGDYRSTYKAIASWTITTASRMGMCTCADLVGVRSTVRLAELVRIRARELGLVRLAELVRITVCAV